MSNKKDKQKILNNEVNEEKLDKVSGGKKGKNLTAKNMEKETQHRLIDYFGYPK